MIDMLHILLLILKIIGITLGILIGIILLALCLALFVPIRYRLRVERTEETDALDAAGNKAAGEAEAAAHPPVEVMAKVTWLLHFINIRLTYSNELKIRLRLLFFTIFKIPSKPKKKEGKARKAKKRGASKKADKDKTTAKDAEPEKADSQEYASKSDMAEQAEQTGESEQTNKSDKISRAEMVNTPENTIRSKSTSASDDNKAISEADKANRTNNTSNDYTGQQKEDGEDDGQDAPPKLSLKEKFIKICGFFKNIWYTIRTICDRIKNIFENIEYYLDIIKSDTFKASFALCRGELVKVLSYIKPRKFEGELVIGTGDPASTGQIIAYYYAILYPFIGTHLRVVGDFEQKRVEGLVLIKGKIKLFTIIKAALRIYFNKDIKKLLKLFKKEDE